MGGQVVKTRGFLALYNGLTASLGRQVIAYNIQHLEAGLVTKIWLRGGKKIGGG